MEMMKMIPKIKKARNKLLKNKKKYLYFPNLEYVKEQEECQCYLLEKIPSYKKQVLNYIKIIQKL